MIGGLGVGELLLLVFLLVLLFGSRKIPEIARGLGQGIRNFKSGVKNPDQVSGGDDRAGEENHGER